MCAVHCLTGRPARGSPKCFRVAATDRARQGSWQNRCIDHSPGLGLLNETIGQQSANTGKTNGRLRHGTASAGMSRGAESTHGVSRGEGLIMPLAIAPAYGVQYTDHETMESAAETQAFATFPSLLRRFVVP